MMASIADHLNPTRRPKVSKAMKAEKTIHRTTFNPLSAKPGETLYIDVPRLQENKVFVPKSLFLRFNDKAEKGEADNHLVQNVSRNLVEHTKVFFGGKTICDTAGYDLFHGFHDMFTREEDMKMGMTSKASRKIRAKGSGDTKVMLLTNLVYGQRYHPFVPSGAGRSRGILPKRIEVKPKI